MQRSRSGIKTMTLSIPTRYIHTVTETISMKDLQSAIDRVLPAIEGTLATLGTGPAHPRELERAARALTALTRTLRELNGLTAEHNTAPVCNCGGPRTPEQTDAMRQELARKLAAFVAQHVDGKAPDTEVEPQQ